MLQIADELADNHLLAPEIEKVLHQVQAHANYMPEWQMEVSGQSLSLIRCCDTDSLPESHVDRIWK